MKHDKALTPLARQLRKNMTREERKLWYDFLKELPVMVHRQKVIDRYIVDFYIAEKRLVIELDGSQHFEAEGKARDALRDESLRAIGLTVLRYSNRDIDRNFDGVCQDILLHLAQLPTKPSPAQKSLLLEEKVAERKRGRMW